MKWNAAKKSIKESVAVLALIKWWRSVIRGIKKSAKVESRRLWVISVQHLTSRLQMVLRVRCSLKRSMVFVKCGANANVLQNTQSSMLWNYRLSTLRVWNEDRYLGILGSLYSHHRSSSDDCEGVY